MLGLLFIGLGCLGISLLLALAGLYCSSKSSTKSMAYSSIVVALIGGGALLRYTPYFSLGALLPLGLSTVLLMIAGDAEK